MSKIIKFPLKRAPTEHVYNSVTYVIIPKQQYLFRWEFKLADAGFPIMGDAKIWGEAQSIEAAHERAKKKIRIYLDSNRKSNIHHERNLNDPGDDCA